jgi:hypothetical protein
MQTGSSGPPMSRFSSRLDAVVDAVVAGDAYEAPARDDKQASGVTPGRVPELL